MLTAGVDEEGTPYRGHVQGLGAEEVKMEYVAIASGVALAVGIRVISLIWELRDTFARPQHLALTATRLDEPRPGGRAGHDTQPLHS